MKKSIFLLVFAFYNFYANAAVLNLNCRAKLKNVNERNLKIKPDFNTVIGSGGPPVASFTASNTNIIAGACVSFNSTSTNNPTSYFWQFPGSSNTIDTSQSSFTCYNTPGCYAVTLTVSNAFGSDSFTDTCYINVTASGNAPVAAFTANNVNINTGQSVNFTDQSSNSPSAWNWAFTGGSPSSSSSQNPSNIIYNTPGCYQVSLIASNAFGSDNETQICYINVSAAGAPPVASFTASNTNIIAGACVSFNSTSTNNPTSYFWQFPGSSNTIDTSQSSFTCYNTPGCYAVTLTVSNAFGSDSFTDTCYINVTASGNAPVAAFTANNVNINTGQSVNFTDQSSNSPSAWNWAFTGGSPSSSSSQNPNNIVYNTPGCYQVALTSSNAFGSDTETQICYINVSAAGAPPVASFTASNTNIIAGACVSFNSTSTNNPTSYFWQFPGSSNTTDTSQSSFTCYNTPGCYAVTLTVSNAFGSDSFTDTCYINVTASGNAPVAAFTANNVNINTGQSVNFTDQSSNSPSAWNWTFTGGSPSSSTNQNPSNIVYNTPGCYQVSLSASNAFGSDNETQICYINVSAAGAAPVASFTASNTNIIAGSCVSFNSTSTNNPTSYFWQFPGSSNTIDTSQSSFTCYNTPGCYAVTLTVSNAFGSDSFTDTCYINVTASGNAPVAAFTANNVNINTGQSVNFTDQSSNSPSAWNWTFTGGSPSSSTNQNPNNIVYNTPGCYQVVLTSSNAFGSDTETQICYINVAAPGTPVITVIGSTAICPGDTVTLSSSASTGNLWSSGQTTQNITVSSAGSYTVSVSDSSGTLTSAPVTITIIPLPIATNLGGPYVQCAGTLNLDAANAGANYLWSNGDTSQTINVTQSGNYYVDITNNCGTVQSSTATITINPVPTIPTITANGPTDFCLGNSVILTSSAPSNNTWSPNNDTTQAITVSQSGSFYSVVTNAFGCSSSSNTITVTVANNPPTATNLGGPFTQCGGSITLDAANAGSSYLWSNGDTSQTINASQSGNYYVAITNGCGTVQSDTAEVTINPIPAAPVITANGPTAFCPGFALTLSSNYSNGNLWSTGQNSNAIVVDAASTFSVTYTDAAGCTSSASSISTSFITNVAPPLFSIVNNNITTSPATATFNNNTPNLSQYNFLWNFGDGSSVNDNNANVTHTYNTNGVFHVGLTLTDASNGCSSTNYNPNNPQQSVICNVGSNNNCGFTPLISPSGVINACIGGNVTISINSSSYPVGATFQWNKNGVALGGENFASYNASSNGFYSVTVFDTSGCPVQSSPTQLIFNLPAAQTPTITQSGQIGNCGIVNATLTANGNFGSYIWNTGQIGNSIAITEAGIYTAVGQAGTGCDASSAPVNISSSNLATPEICMITVDSITNQSVIVWEKDVSTAIFGYGIYKESSFNSNNYLQIAIVPYDSLSEYTDINSDAEVLAERYRISIIDTCFGETSLSSAVRAIGLKVFPGIGVQRSLSWNSYVGDNQNITQYNIYSGPDYNQLTLIDAVPANINNYIDGNPVYGLNTVYRVYADLSSACESIRAIRNKSLSNGTGNIQNPFVNSIGEISDIDVFDFNIFPNPNNGLFTLVLSDNNATIASIYDITGKLLVQEKLMGKTNTMNLQALSRGTYIVQVIDNKGFTAQRLVVIN
jgi:PKD repeat protein